MNAEQQCCCIVLSLCCACNASRYLITHVPWYGPIYHEACRLEEKAEEYETALAIVEQGLK